MLLVNVMEAIEHLGEVILEFIILWNTKVAGT